MQGVGIHGEEMLLLLLLLLVVGLAELARRVETPFPIVLVIGGLILSLVPGIPRVSLNPQVVFLGILPPLVFYSAFSMSWREFRTNIVSILMLAFGLVGFTVAGVAAFAHFFIPGFDWRLGSVLGAVVSTTDAIAATSIARRLKLPRRIVDVIEGESLVNDASGLLALEFTVAMVVSGVTPTIGAGIARLLWLTFAGLGIGLAVGRVIEFVEGYVNDPAIEITISIMVPFVSYLAAEAAHASGVLATMACGLYLGRQSSKFFSSETRLQAFAVWETINFILNGLVFILIGLELHYVLLDIRGMSVAQLFIGGAVFSLVVIGLRMLWMYPGARTAYWIRGHWLRRSGHPPEALPGARQVFIVGWTGMRGVVALAAALSLPALLENGDPFPGRNLILFLTFCVIFFTLVVQGLSLPPLIRKLKLVQSDGENDEEELRARRKMAGAALAYLHQGPARDDPSVAFAFQELEQRYSRRLAAADKSVSKAAPKKRDLNSFRALAAEVRSVERETALKLREQDQISDELLRKLERELDLMDTVYVEPA